MTTDFCLLEMQELVGAVGRMLPMEEEEVMAVVEQMVNQNR